MRRRGARPGGAVRALALAALALAVPAAGATAPRVQTLVEAKGEISVFAQDGRYLAWETIEQTKCGLTMRIRDLARGFQKGIACGRIEPTRQLALANGRALWLESEFGNFQYHRLYTGSLTQKTRLVLDDEGYSSGDPLEYSLTGDGNVLGYATWRGGPLHEDACIDFNRPKDCKVVVKAGGFYRVGRNGITRWKNVPPAWLAVAGGGKVAVAVAGAVGTPPLNEATVEVYPLPPGARVPPAGGKESVRALAFDGKRVAVLTTTQIAVHTIAPGRGRFEWMLAPPGIAPELSMSTCGVVFRVGRSIRVFGRGEVARAASKPIGLSIEGCRIAWAENVGGRGRIRALTLP